MGNYVLSKVKPEHYNSIAAYRQEIMDSDGEFDGCQQLELYDDIEKWDLNCKLFEDPATVPPGYSLGYQYLYLDDDEVIGMINLRPLAETHPYLSRYGGHIGYSVKPSRRKQGVASQMLKDMLKICKDEYQLNKVLITCMKDNEASRRVIINNGGVYENEIMYPPEEKILERYWISI
ncbi:MAG: GNAT family N-acetyltransferase [Erysipelotrichaceae bacterium]|nr:GNAT family N-acetyltransferase [Erysipelotrichaceae bacterium]